MRTTFTLMTFGKLSRVATAADFLALGEGNMQTPGWLHLYADWKRGRPHEASVALADNAGVLYHNLTEYQCHVVIAHLRKYEAQNPELLE